MRKLVPLSLFAILVYMGCKKDDTPTTPAPAKPSKLSLLTQKQWIYDELYLNYNGVSGTLLYKRGVTVDPVHDGEIDIFWPDGTAHQIFSNTSTVTFWTWKFLDKDSTRFSTTTSSSTNPSIIQVLDSLHFQYYDTLHHILGKMTWLY